MVKLTAKQRKFVDKYIETGNATEAAIEAGYSKNSARQMGTENLSKPVIKNLISERTELLQKRSIANANEVLEYLTKVLRGTARETVNIATIDGVEQVNNPPTIKDRMAAGRELLKRYPADDAILEAQLRKLTAEADMAEFKARLVADPSSLEDRVIIIDDFTGGDGNQEITDKPDN